MTRISHAILPNRQDAVRVPCDSDGILLLPNLLQMRRRRCRLEKVLAGVQSLNITITIAKTDSLVS